MIVAPEDRPESARLRMVTQSDHAWLAGEVLSLWRADGLPQSPRRPDLVFATREHDNGWRETDSAPLVDPDTGRPFDFTTLPDGPRIELWRRGIARHASTRPYPALLVCRHAQALHADRRGEPAWDEGLFEALDELVDELADMAGETGADPETVAADYRLLALADRVSLAACSAAGAPFAFGGYRGHVEGSTVHLEPFPFAGATSFDLPCRTIPDRRYSDSVDLIGELASARWTTTRVRVAPRVEHSRP